MNIAIDTRPLKIAYDKSKGGFRVMRGSSPIHTAKTKIEAEDWMKKQEVQIRVVQLFFNRLKPTLTAEEHLKVLREKRILREEILQ